jgi:hypothetical protein
MVAAVVLLCGARLPAAAQEDPARSLGLALAELQADDGRLRASFAKAQRTLGSALAEHRRATELVNRQCVGLAASNGGLRQADGRLAELEEQNRRLQVRQGELDTLRRELELARIGVEQEASARARDEAYRRQMWRWMRSYQNTYLRPFEGEVVGGIRIYAEAVHFHAVALNGFADTCRTLRADRRGEPPAVVPDVAVLATVVGLIQRLQNLLIGGEA